MRKIALFSILPLIVMGLLSTTAMAGDDPKQLIKLATLAPKGSSMSRVFEKLDEEMRKASNNEIGLRTYFGGIQGRSEGPL